jgi:nucleoid-associated protein YgaU
MKKDFKIGMFIGLAVVIVAAVWLSLLPALSVSSRLRNLQNQQRNSQTANAQIFTQNQKENYKLPAEEKKQQENQKIQQEQPKQTSDKLQTKQSQPSSSKPVEPIKANETRYHTVLGGQTLSDIAIEYYGSANEWTKIRDANPKVDPYKLKPGTTLIIPP